MSYQVEADRPRLQPAPACNRSPSPHRSAYWLVRYDLRRSPLLPFCACRVTHAIRKQKQQVGSFISLLNLLRFLAFRYQLTGLTLIITWQMANLGSKSNGHFWPLAVIIKQYLPFAAFLSVYYESYPSPLPVLEKKI